MHFERQAAFLNRWELPLCAGLPVWTTVSLDCAFWMEGSSTILTRSSQFIFVVPGSPMDGRTMKTTFWISWLFIFIAVAAAGQTKTEVAQESVPSAQSQGQTAPQAPQPADAQPAQDQASQYNKVIFQNPISGNELAFLRKFEGAASGDVVRDKQFHKLMKSVIPDCMFHYGHDMPLLEAMETVLNGSPQPARIRDGRYFVVSGRSGPYLQGRGFLWFDLQDGIALGGFYFHPTNGEPTPAVNVFSRQVKEQFLALSELPPAFVQDLTEWSEDYRVPPVTTRYFITGSNRKILLEHDEDYCGAGDADSTPSEPAPGPGSDHGPAPAASAPADSECQRMNADAADIDMDAANYLEQVHYATNATAWMITGEDQKTFIRVRATTCGDFLPCRIRLTRERVHVIIRRPPSIHPRVTVPVGKH